MGEVEECVKYVGLINVSLLNEHVELVGLQLITTALTVILFFILKRILFCLNGG